MVRPTERSVWSGKSLLEVALMVRLRKWHTAEFRVVWEIAESFDLSGGEASRSIGGGSTCLIMCRKRYEGLSKLVFVYLDAAHFQLPVKR